MGFGKFTHFFNNIGKALSKAGTSLKKDLNKIPNPVPTLKKGLNTAVSVPTTLYKDVKSGLGTLHKDARDLISGAGSTVKDVVMGGQQVLSNLGGDLKGAADDLSMPLTIGLGVAALGLGVYIMNSNNK